MEPLILHSLVRKLQAIQTVLSGTGMSAAASSLGLAHMQQGARALHAAGATVSHHLYSAQSQPQLPPAQTFASRGGPLQGRSSRPQQGRRPQGRGAAGVQWGRGASGRQSYSSTAAAASSSSAAAAASTQQQDNGTVQPGRLVEFKRGSDYFLGLVVKPGSKSNWMVEDAAGTVYSVGGKDISCVLPGTRYSQADLAEVASQAAGLADASLLELAWEISESSAFYTVPEMASFIFGEQSAASCAAAHRLLREDRVFFKHAGRTPPIFSPRPPEQVELLQRQHEAEQKEGALWAQFTADIAAAQRAQRAAKPGPRSWVEGPHAERIALLEGYATGEADDGQKVKAIKTLNELRMAPTPAAAAEVLQGIGYWPAHMQLSLLTSGITETFRPDLEELARQLIASPPPDPDAATRRDLTHLTVYTIDDESTTEIDDGLSVERLPSGERKIWVHVADPTRYLKPGDPLDLEARRRTTSLYLPTGMCPMFPKALAEGPFSLLEGLQCCALSVGIVLGPDGEVLLDRVEVLPSTIIPTQRLSYNTADEMYAECTPEEEPSLFALLEAAELRRQHRMERGATEINMPECLVEVDDPVAEAPRVTLTKEEPALSMSRQVVAEMMILAGEAAGMLGGRLRVPLPYRGQPEPILPDPAALAAVPEGPCQSIMLRNSMLRSQTLTGAPVRHAGLGLEAYVQVTSPIRRYGDMLAHYQLKAQLRGEAPPFSADQLGILVDGVADQTQKMSKLEREVESYWTALYFQQQQRSNSRAVWHAMFLCWFKQDAGLGRVLLRHLGLEVIVRVTRGGVVPGTCFFVTCTHADPRLGVFRLDEVPDNMVEEDYIVGAPEDEMLGESSYEALIG